MTSYFFNLARLEESIRPESPIVDEFLEVFRPLVNKYAEKSMSYDETINERISAGFLSDTPLGRKQQFFAWLDANKDREDFDGHEAQRREHEAGITQTDWECYRRSFVVEF